MGISRARLFKQKHTGAKIHIHRKKRKYELGRPPAMTKLTPGEFRVHNVRCRGGRIKRRALRLDGGIFSWGSETIARKTRILDVVYNSTNNELVRTKTLVKGCIVSIDCTPFRNWYYKHYGVTLCKRPVHKLKGRKGAHGKKVVKKSTGGSSKASSTAKPKKVVKAKKPKASSEKKEEAKEEKKGKKEKKEKKEKKAEKKTEKKTSEKDSAKKGADKKGSGKKSSGKKGSAKKRHRHALDSVKHRPANTSRTGKLKKPSKKSDSKQKPSNEKKVRKYSKGSKPHKPIPNRRARAWKTRGKSRVLDRALRNAFRAGGGRLLARIASSPGQVGRADGYILEGKELEFYQRKLDKKRKK
eukprot:NODE_545_length_1304_cov_3695.645418_g393_i0.p1 GENE.NODE_545_length_1304_cov_3695.645418_g393_i0~~NODE_545_length_1304_cov_3695.645418_g393_i0.p1  ORF type:complete len:356 (+),score=170.61 NODE_545_length_1304_cov_3695.645418_g393_i0:101-1168(+)